ncbi:coiled-coil domain-containing protein 57 [Lampetra fluviatilis]
MPVPPEQLLTPAMLGGEPEPLPVAPLVALSCAVPDAEVDEESIRLERLLGDKEQEWHELQKLRARVLAESVRRAERATAEERERFLQLKDDFKFNLRLLEERDGELEHCEADLASARSDNAELRAHVSELSVQADRLRSALAAARRDGEEETVQHRERLRELRLDTERARGVVEAQLSQRSEELERLRRELERKVEETCGELGLQKQELLAEFDVHLQKREHEFRLHADQMSNTVLAHELKVRLLGKELEAAQAANERYGAALGAAETAQVELEKRLREAEWALRDEVAVRDARIKELEERAEDARSAHAKELELLNRKCTELDRQTRESAAALERVRAAGAERERALEAQLRELRGELQDGEVERKRLEWSHADALHLKDHDVEKLREELQLARTAWDTHVTQQARQTVRRDVETEADRQALAKMRAELIACQDASARYKQELALAVQRQEELEREREQLALDSQRRAEERESALHRQGDKVLQPIMQARDQAVLRLKERERELSEAVSAGARLRRQRDRAMATLLKHGIAMQDSEPQDEESDLAGTDDSSLRVQNAALRAVIGEMRREMEALTGAGGKAIREAGVSPAIRGAEPQLEATVRRQAGQVARLAATVAQLTRQEDLRRLRLIADPGGAAVAETSHPRVAELQVRLRQAARHVARLSHERQQLLELGNRLRARLASAGLHESEDEPRSEGEDTDPGQRRLSAQGHGDKTRLSQLEELQYQLTSQELQFAQHSRRVPLLPAPADSGETDRSSQMAPTPAQREALLSSDGGGSSLHELWKMLEQDDPGSSPSYDKGAARPSTSRSPRCPTATAIIGEPHTPEKPSRDAGPEEIAVRARGLTPHARPRKVAGHNPWGDSTNSSGKSRTPGRGRVRNYNVRD